MLAHALWPSTVPSHLHTPSASYLARLLSYDLSTSPFVHKGYPQGSHGFDWILYGCLMIVNMLDFHWRKALPVSSRIHIIGFLVTQSNRGTALGQRLNAPKHCHDHGNSAVLSQYQECTCHFKTLSTPFLYSYATPLYFILKCSQHVFKALALLSPLPLTPCTWLFHNHPSSAPQLPSLPQSPKYHLHATRIRPTQRAPKLGVSLLRQLRPLRAGYPLRSLPPTALHPPRQRAPLRRPPRRRTQHERHNHDRDLRRHVQRNDKKSNKCNRDIHYEYIAHEFSVE